MYGRLADRLTGPTRREAVALLVDDLQWSDPATAELVEHLVRHPPARPHLVALATRPGPAMDRLVDRLVATGPGGGLLDLAPLSPADAAPLVRDLVSPADREQVYVASGGNPFLLHELVRDRARGGSASTPTGISTFVVAELDRLTPPARQLLRAGAVLGDPFDFGVAAAVAGMDEDDGPGRAAELIDELVAVALLVPATTPRLVRFRHPVVRSAVLDGLAPGARVVLHDLAAAVLARLGTPAPVLARHLALAARPGDRHAAAVLREAAAMVASRSPTVAADWLLAADRTEPDRLEHRPALAERLVDAGRFEEAVRLVDETLANPGARERDRLRLVLVAATVERLTGHHQSAERRLRRALQESPAEDAGSARLAAHLALAAFERGDVAETGEWAARSRDTTGVGTVIAGAAEAMLGVARRFTGEEEAATRHMDRCVGLLTEATEAELTAEIGVLHAVPWALIANERLDAARDVARRGTEASRHTSGHGTASVALELASVLSLGLLGRVTECVAAAEAGTRGARLSGNEQALQWARWMQAWALHEQGDLPAALSAVEESVALAERLDDTGLVMVARAVHGLVLVAAGRPALGRPLLLAYSLDPGWVCRYSPAVVRASLDLGEPAAAAAHADLVRGLAATLGLAGPRAAAARAAGMVSLATGDLGRAVSLADEVIELAHRVGARLEISRADLLAGRALAVSDPGAAVVRLERAAEAAAAGGAHGIRNAAVRELRRLGRRHGRGGPRAAGQQGLTRLSGREREVAVLVAEGCTNREIADRLYLSEKTVESHLSRAFSKLDVRSRAALAGLVARTERNA